MIVYRLSRSRYAGDVSGRGAERTGGRWNNKGTPMIYASVNRALCVAEVAVHTPLGLLPPDYMLTIMDLPDRSISFLSVDQLRSGWDSFPHSEETQRIGDEFVRECRSLALRVPSAVVQGEYNILINPLHPDIRLLAILKKEAFRFDERLFRRR